MKGNEVKRAAVLLAAVSDLQGVRSGLRHKVTRGIMRLEIGAFEAQGDGGTGYRSALIDLETAPAILDEIERIVCAELAALGVSVDIL